MEKEVLDKAHEFIISGNYNSAEKVLTDYLLENPKSIDVLFRLAYLYQIQKKLSDALGCYKKLLEIKPQEAGIYNNIAHILLEERKFKDAEKVIESVLPLEIISLDLLNTLGIVKGYMGKFDEAEIIFKEIIDNYPDFAESYLNLGNILDAKGKLDEAEELLKTAIKKEFNKNSAEFNLSLLYLKKGEYLKGWELYETRKLKKEYPKILLSKPELKNIGGISNSYILVYDEQGFGDTIQFVRFLPYLKNFGGKIILVCHQSLVRLLANCSYIDKIIPKDSFNEKQIDYDFYISLLSIPNLFKISLNILPSQTPYLIPSLNKKLENLLKTDKYKIGIVWKGRQPLENFYRSAKLIDLLPVLNLNGTQIVSLQKDVSEEEKNLLQEKNIVDASEVLLSFDETASIISKLDCMISIDTSVAHLSGALGKTTYLMLSSRYDWRWKEKKRKSLWYPDITLVKQTEFGNWSDVVFRIKEYLEKTIN